MLTWNDAPTIRWAILKRLETEPGVRFVHVFAKPFPGFIGVGVEATVRDTLVTRSHFRLPVQFERAALHREIDQIAEQLKAAWRAHRGTVRSDQSAKGQLAGTGGDWRVPR
jgi:hypothetical protein